MMESDSTDRVELSRPRSSSACLVFIYPIGPGLGRRYALGTSPLLLGRDEDCDVCLDDPAVSRRHARVQPTADGFYTLDLDSTNGTFVNEQPVARQRLQDGDYLRVGSSIFRFLDRDSIETAYHEEVYRLTILDALTGLHNRRYLLEFLDTERVRSARYGRRPALVLLDVDHFKAINDQRGHLAGDEALRQLAALLTAQIRASDLATRYGGEEFALVLLETGREDALAVAERVRGAVEGQAFVLAGQPFRLTVSLGVATPDEQLVGAETLFRWADEKLLQAKQSGRNRVVG
jgi:two-component system cell cycle response regulator